MNTEEFLRSQIRKILTEQSGEDDATSRIRSVGVGRGGWKGRVKEAGALAKEDPAKLMSNLKIDGVKNSRSKAGLDSLEDLLEKAASGTEEMKAVYSLLGEKSTAKDKDGNVLDSVILKVSTLTPRDALKYIEHTIVGATKAFGIQWEKEIEITKSGKSVVVYLK